jgi:hypothetical protein
MAYYVRYSLFVLICMIRFHTTMLKQFQVAIQGRNSFNYSLIFDCMLFIRERISSPLFDVIAYLRRMDNELYVYTIVL